MSPIAFIQRPVFFSPELPHPARLGCHPDGEGDEQGEYNCQQRHAAQIQHGAHSTQCSQVGAQSAEHNLPYSCAELQ